LTNNFPIKTHGLIKTTVPSFPRGQDYLSQFHNKAFNQDELTRIQLAKDFCQNWQKSKIGIPLPAVISKNDFWYLVQLFALNHHVHKNQTPYFIDLSVPENIYLENLPEANYPQLQNFFSPLTKLLFSTAKVPHPTQFLSRDLLDHLLATSSAPLLRQIGFDPDSYKIIPIPYDSYLRLSSKYHFGKFFLNTHFDGYRLRTDGQLTGLFGGNTHLGGPSFIDSLWTETRNLSIITRLVIIRKNYGQPSS
jgi:hypothetical protein